MTDNEVLTVVREAFAMPRPAHFTDHPGCSECAEHDETLQAHTIESLGYGEVGSAAWNPITMCTPEAFAYWLPGLARIVLAPEDPHWGWYGENLFQSQLTRDGRRNDRSTFCTAAQRKAVAALIEHVIDTRAVLVHAYDLERDMLEALAIWWDAGEADGEKQ